MNRNLTNFTVEYRVTLLNCITSQFIIIMNICSIISNEEEEMEVAMGSGGMREGEGRRGGSYDNILA